MSADTLIALVYRNTKGCKQHHFHSFEELEKFCSRRPYCRETLLVIPVLNRVGLARALVRADHVVEYVKTARAAV